MIATQCKSHVAITEHDRDAAVGYAFPMLSEWLRQAIEKSGRSQSDLARHLTKVLGRSIDRAAVNKMVSNKRAIAADEMVEAARYLNAPSPADAPTSGLRTVRVAAHVQAGDFVEHWEWPFDDQYDVAVPADANLAQYRLFAAETRGPSMNRRWPERTVVVFSSIEETEESPMAGRRYVVERLRADGLAEHTVKLLHQDDKGHFWLLPESNDPLHQAPIPVTGEDGDQVKILGRVHYSVSRE